MVRSLSLVFFAGLIHAFGFSVQDRVMSKEISECDRPLSYSVFPTTSERIYLWMSLSSATTSDVFRYEWINPSGNVYRSGTWDRRSGNFCAWAWLSPRETGMPVGPWGVRVFGNNTQLFTSEFTVATRETACSNISVGLVADRPDALTSRDCQVGEYLAESDGRYAKRFRLQIATPGVLRADLSSGDFDAYLILLNSRYEIVARDDDSGPGLDARLVVRLQPGEYSLLVTSYRRDTGAFRLRTFFQDPQACGMGTISVSDRLRDRLTSNDCQLIAFLADASPYLFARQYRLVVSQPGTLTISMRSGDFDTYLYLVDTRYRQIAYDDDSGTGTDSFIRMPIQPGVYYIVATTYYEGSIGEFTVDTSFSTGNETVYLFLHGLNSDNGTWDDVNDDVFDNACTPLDSVRIVERWDVPTRQCYLFNFGPKSVSGTLWGSGDGSTYSELGQEVGRAVDFIRNRQRVHTLILVGHSRGGLAARAYLQSLPTRLPFRVGLFTIGTPHQGSPVGRIQPWLLENAKKPEDENCTLVPEGRVRFVFSPSTGYLASSHTASKQPLRNAYSEAIWVLNGGAARLDGMVDLYGQITSSGIKLGENIVARVDLWSILGCLTSTSEEKARLQSFILQNLPDDWLNSGDGIVPLDSQEISNIPGLRRTKSVWSIDIKDRTNHVGETGKTGEIKSVLDRLTSEIAKLPPLPATPFDPVGGSGDEAQGTASTRGAAQAVSGLEWQKLVADLAAAGVVHSSSPHVGDIEAFGRERLRDWALTTLEDSSVVSVLDFDLTTRALAIVADEKSIAALLRQYDLDTEEVRSNRVRELLKSRKQLPVDTLAQAARTGADRTTRLATELLARNGSPEAARELVLWAANLADPDLGHFAATLMAGLRSQKALRTAAKELVLTPFLSPAIKAVCQASIEERLKGLVATAK